MIHFFTTKPLLFTTFTKKALLSIVLLSVSFSAQAFTKFDGKPDLITNHIGKNKWTVVEVWESNCHICRMHMPDMVKFDGKLKNTRVLGVSLDTQHGVEAAQDFVGEYGIKFPTIISNFVEMNIWMQKALNEPLQGTPTFILFDPDGALVAAKAGIVSTESLEKFIKLNSNRKPDEKVITVDVHAKDQQREVQKSTTKSAPIAGLPDDSSVD